MTIDEVKKTLREYSKSYPATERVKAYEQGALSRLKTLSLPVKKSELTQEQRQHLSKEAENLYGMLAYTQRCYDAIKANDIDLFAQSFERVTEYRIAVGIKHLDSKKQSKRGKGKKGKEGPVKQAIRRIIEKTGISNPLKLSELIFKRERDIFHSRNNPLPVRFEADNRDRRDTKNRDILYTVIETGKEGSITFKRLQAILSEIKK